MYRKRFSLPAEWRPHDTGSSVQLVFDGALQYSEVYLNGQHVADHRGGYTRFVVRLDNVTGDGALQFGSGVDNVVTVRTDCRWGSGHWYEGGGIIRAVTLEWLPPVHFVTGGVFVSPELGADGTIFASAELESRTAAETTAKYSAAVSFVLSTLDGTLVAHNTSAPVVVGSGTPPVVVSCSLSSIAAALPIKLWDTFSYSANKTIHAPMGLYVMSFTLHITASTKASGFNRTTTDVVVVDRANVTAGFRTTKWKQKFWLNGHQTQLRGFSHHDNFAGVGVAMPARIFLFHAQANRALGGNFWRMSHNPYDDVIYSILDALGILVWDEARDFWVSRVDEFRALVKHHRSHPCIVVYGLCNEQVSVIATLTYFTSVDRYF
eukprot:SAG31_NODE_66_length_28567_cov_30.222698_22_plen_378_part_00